MYSDPSLIRRHFVKISLNDREAGLVNGLCEYSGEQKATFLRELVLAKALEVMRSGHEGVLNEKQRSNGAA